MTNYLEYNDPLHIVFRKGTVDDPYVPKTTTQKIINNIIVLDEIPDEFSHVTISGYTEIYKGEPTSTQFKVNYQNGIVTFNQSEEGKTITASYMGRAVILYPAERIYTHSDDPNVIKTLQKMIDDGEEAINAVGGLQGKIDEANTLKTDLGTLVTNGITLESDLSGQISEGNTLIPDLNTAVTTANTAKGQLDGTIESANTSIDELNAYAFIEEYNANTDYVPLNKVVYQGSTYQNKVACKNILPTNTTYWILVSAKGVDGTGTIVTPSEINGNVILDGVETTVYAHPGSGTNPHGTTKEDIGLGNVENKSSATIIGEITKEDIVSLGIPAQDTDTIYTHPNNHPASMITEDETHRFVSDTEKATWSNAEINANSYTDDAIETLAGVGHTTETVRGNADALVSHKNETAIHTKIIAIEEGTTEPPVENGALLVIYEVVV